MPTEVILPRVDMDMATGTISRWHVREGERVAKGAPLFDIETDKAAMEIEAPESGTLGAIAVAEGASAPVGTTVATIYADGEAMIAPAAKSPARVASADAAPARSVALAATVAAKAPAGGRVTATPLARRLARERGLGLEAFAGSGPRGRVGAGDVRRAAASGAMRDGAVAAAAPAVVDDPMLELHAPGSYELVPLDPMRRAIAARLTRATQTVPHFYLSATCDLESVLAARARLNAEAPRDRAGVPVYRVSLDDFIIKALGLALQRLPDANVTYSDSGLLRHRRSDVGFAVAVPGGHYTPVVRGVEAMPLSRLAAEVRDLAERARARKLAPAECQGGTTAVSNLGMHGIEEFTAIINPPQATILAVGAASRRPAVVGDSLAVRTQMTCTLSCDHRAVDGAVAAELLGTFRALIEDPTLMLA